MKMADAVEPKSEETSKLVLLKRIITLESNWPVIKEFLLFSVLIIMVPITLMFVCYKSLCIMGFSAQYNMTIASAVAIIAVNVLSGLYAYNAYKQEKIDYAESAEKKKS